MGSLPGPLPLLLGGAEQPWIVNLLPAEDTQNAKVMDPLRFSIKDSLLSVDEATLRVVVAYAKTKSDGTAKFEILPRTIRTALFQSPILQPPTISLVSGGVRIVKTSSSPQNSVYASAVDIGGATSRLSALVTAVLSPDVETAGAQGAVLGLEYGPRNTGVYAFFQTIGVDKVIRITGPSVNGLRVPNLIYLFDWSGASRYILFWNERASPPTMEFYTDSGGIILPLSALPISSFQELDPSQSESTPRLSRVGDAVGIYGQEGASGDQVTIRNIAISGDVGYPIGNGVHSGEFVTRQEPDFLVTYPGGVDPREAQIAPWFDPPTPLFPVQDPDGTILVLSSKEIDFEKPTAGQAISVYRKEPSFLRLNAEGLIVEATFRADTTAKDITWAGSGFLLFDSSSVYQLSLFDNGSNKSLGLRRSGVGENMELDHFLTTPLDWLAPVTMRLILDPRRNKIEIYNKQEPSTPILSIPFDRMTLPTASDYGYVATDIPFIAFGFPRQSAATGSIKFSNLTYSYIYQALEAQQDQLLPTAADPVYTQYSTGGSASLDPDKLVISTAPGEQFYYGRALDFDPTRGVAIEAEFSIAKGKAGFRSGAFLAADNGIFNYALSFMHADTGLFVCLAQSGGGSTFKEIFGVSGRGSKFSFPFDWTQMHRYRLECRPTSGVSIFVDSEPTPRLVVPNSIATPPLTLFGIGSVGFGHFTFEGTESNWKYVRTFAGGGYEISLRKNESVKDLRTEIFDTQATVLVQIQD